MLPQEDAGPALHRSGHGGLLRTQGKAFTTQILSLALFGQTSEVLDPTSYGEAA